MTEMSGIILAGGKARRMGQDKALLPFHHHTLLEEMVDKMHALQLEDVMVSHHQTSLPIRVIPDLIPECGPLSGLHACFLQARFSSALVLSVDIPLISQETLKRLIVAHQMSPKQATLLIHEGYIEPLIGIYDCHLAEVIEEQLKKQDYRVKTLLSHIDYQTVTLTGPSWELTNCNTQEDYQKALTYLNHITSLENKTP